MNSPTKKGWEPNLSGDVIVWMRHMRAEGVSSTAITRLVHLKGIPNPGAQHGVNRASMVMRLIGSSPRYMSRLDQRMAVHHSSGGKTP